MKLGLLFGSVVLLIAGVTLVGYSWEVNAQSEEGFKRYENATLGISFQHPSNWTKEEHPLCAIAGCLDFFTTVPKLDTTSNATVKTALNQIPGDCGGNQSKPSFNDSIMASDRCDVYSINVWVFDLNNPNPSFSEKPCNCNTLKDFVAWHYNRNYIDIGGFKNTFINDNQTIIGNNQSAWQMESIQSFTGSDGSKSKDKQFTVWAKNGNLGYTLEYSFPADSRFDRYLDIFKNMLKSVTFTTVEPEKKPSFLNSDVQNSSVLLSAPKVQDEPIRIASSNDFIDSLGFLHVVGEIENNSPTSIQFVKVSGTFYDGNNQVVGTGSTYTDPSDIGSGQKAPFELLLTSASIPISQIDHYNLQATYD